jgi:Ribbon-helix-helix protein, copG family
MPTANPRINVTLSPSLDALVGRMARLQRASKSQVLRELLEAAEPALQRAANLMEAASNAASELKASVVRSMEAQQSQAEAALAHHLGYLETVSQDLVAQAQEIRARRPPRVAQATLAGAAPGAQRAPDPPASNRGVKSPTGRKTAKARRSAK